MEEVIHYLELKNRYYEKFHEISEKFLQKTDREEWDDLAFFVDNRERILNIIRSFDFKIAKSFQKLAPHMRELDKYQSRVKALLERRKELADRIVKLDLELISRIDELKTETIRELKRGVETAQQLESFSGFSSSSRPTKTVKSA